MKLLSLAITGEIAQDGEGMSNLRRLAENMGCSCKNCPANYQADGEITLKYRSVSTYK